MELEYHRTCPNPVVCPCLILLCIHKHAHVHTHMLLHTQTFKTYNSYVVARRCTCTCLFFCRSAPSLSPPSPPTPLSTLSHYINLNLHQFHAVCNSNLVPWAPGPWSPGLPCPLGSGGMVRSVSCRRCCPLLAEVPASLGWSHFG